MAHPAGPISLHIDPPTSANSKRGQVRTIGYRLLPGCGFGTNRASTSSLALSASIAGHKKLYGRWDAAGRPDDYQAMEDCILEWLAHWMPSQQAWTTVSALSRNTAGLPINRHRSP